MPRLSEVRATPRLRNDGHQNTTHSSRLDGVKVAGNTRDAARLFNIYLNRVLNAW